MLLRLGRRHGFLLKLVPGTASENTMTPGNWKKRMQATIRLVSFVPGYMTMIDNLRVAALSYPRRIPCSLCQGACSRVRRASDSSGLANSKPCDTVKDETAHSEEPCLVCVPEDGVTRNLRDLGKRRRRRARLSSLKSRP